MRNGSSHDYIARYRTSDGAYEHVSVVGIIQHLQISNIWVKFHVEKVCLPSAGRAVQFLTCSLKRYLNLCSRVAVQIYVANLGF